MKKITFRTVRTCDK